MGSQAAGQLVPAVSATSPPSPVSDILDRLPRLVRRSTGDFVRPRTDPQVFIEHELDVDLLDGLHKWLWLAGRVDNIRPLHHQKLLGRTVMITERAKAHLIWTEDKIFLKPLPEWMTNQAFSNKYIPERSLLRRRTNGFIRTWLYLVQHESDFLLAKELDLLPQKMDWTGWLNFVDANHHLVLQDVSSRTPRYAYGELRLYRINLLYRFLPPWRSDRFFRGYRKLSNRPGVRYELTSLQSTATQTIRLGSGAISPGWSLFSSTSQSSSQPCSWDWLHQNW